MDDEGNAGLIRRLAQHATTRQGYEKLSDDGYARQVIQRIGTVFELDLNELRNMQEEGTGQSRSLRWEHFRARYPTFPLYLGTKHLEALDLSKGLTTSTFFKHFQHSPLIEAYDLFWDESQAEASGRPIGLAAVFKGVVGGVVVHDRPEPYCVGPAWRLSTQCDTTETEVSVWVEPLYRTLDEIKASGWLP